MDREPPIKAITTTFTIIETLIDVDGAGISELASRLELPKSTVHDHLTTLNEIGYISKEDGTYRVGTRLLRMGAQLQRNFELYNVARPELKKLAETTGEHTSLMIEENGLGVYLHSIEGTNTMKLISVDGMATKLHTTAPGKAILAHLPESKRDSIFAEHGLPAATRNTITEREELESHLERIHDRGYAFDDGETLEAMRGVAAPIVHTTENEVHGAVSVYEPRRQTGVDEFENEMLDELLRISNIIEVNLSY
jgi:DNA-binding IclR family transcriptional regulator